MAKTPSREVYCVMFKGPDFTLETIHRSGKKDFWELVFQSPETLF